MSGNAEEPGPSKQMSIEEQARDANKSWWPGQNEEREEVEAAAGAASGELANNEHEGREDDAETTDEYGASEHSDDYTTTDGGDHTASGSGTKPTAEKKAKRPRKDQTPQV